MSDISSFSLPTTIQEAAFCAILATENISWLNALSHKYGRTVSTTVACLRTLGLIGNQEALHLLQGYQVDKRSGVRKEYQNILCGLAGKNSILKQQVSLETYISKTGENMRILIVNMQDQRLLEGISYYLHLVPYAIQGLILSYARTLMDLTPLAELRQLQCLQFSWCTILEDLSPLTSFTHLQDLEFVWCSRLRDLSPLATLTQLHSLRLEQAYRVKDLTPLMSLTHLQSLHLSRADSLTDLTPLTALLRLQHLDLSCCQMLTDLAPLARLPQLQSLRLECKKLIDLSPLSLIKTLTKIDLSGSIVKDLTPLMDLPSLLWVRLPHEWYESHIVKSLHANGVQIEFDVVGMSFP